MCEENYDEVTNLINQVREHFGTRKTIWVYSGYTYSELYSMKCGLDVDILVDGPFVLSEKDISIKFRGSKNQNIIKLT